MKILQGTFDKSRSNPDEPRPDLVTGIPVSPRRLKGEARREWDRVAPELSRLGVLAVDELSVLATYCGLHAAIVAGEKCGKLAPAGYYGQYRGMVADFGLTPSSRSKVKSHKPQAKQNEWSDIANG